RSATSTGRPWRCWRRRSRRRSISRTPRTAGSAPRSRSATSSPGPSPAHGSIASAPVAACSRASCSGRPWPRHTPPCRGSRCCLRFGWLSASPSRPRSPEACRRCSARSRPPIARAACGCSSWACRSAACSRLRSPYGWRAAFLGTAALAALWVPCWLAVTSRPRVRAALEDPGDQGPRPSMLAVAAHPAVKRGLVGLLAIVPASAFAMAWEAKYYVRQFGLSQAGLVPYLVASAVAYDAGALVFGDLAARRARRRQHDMSAPKALLASGAVLAAAGFLGLALAPNANLA